jgi:hypothetical protein
MEDVRDRERCLADSSVVAVFEGICNEDEEDDVDVLLVAVVVDCTCDDDEEEEKEEEDDDADDCPSFDFAVDLNQLFMMFFYGIYTLKVNNFFQKSPFVFFAVLVSFSLIH